MTQLKVKTIFFQKGSPSFCFFWALKMEKDDRQLQKWENGKEMVSTQEPLKGAHSSSLIWVSREILPTLWF